jgi:hypothetical protein
LSRKEREKFTRPPMLVTSSMVGASVLKMLTKPSKPRSA